MTEQDWPFDWTPPGPAVRYALAPSPTPSPVVVPPVPVLDLGPWIAAMSAHLAEASQRISEALVPIAGWIRELHAAHPDLFPPREDPYERALHARRTRSTGPAQRRLDGRRRR